MSWYKEGLQFKCTGCGECCTGAPGYVFVTLEEMEAIAIHLGLSLESFTQTFIKKVGDRYSLIEKGDRFDCVFLDGKKCSIYSVRPRQCRTFPFWPANLKSEQHWEQTKKMCEGISDEAPLITLQEIQKLTSNF